MRRASTAIVTATCFRKLSWLSIGLALAGLIVAAPSAQAVTAFWTGVGGANWGGNGGTQNWSSDANTPGIPYTPVNGDSLRWFGTGRPNLSSTNDLVGLSVSGISFQGSPTGVVLGGNTLTLTGNITQGGTGPTLNLPLELGGGVSIEGGQSGSVLTINGVITETGGSRNLNIQNGEVALYGDNSFSGNMIIGVGAASTLYIDSLADAGVSQSLGTRSSFQLGHNNVSSTIIYTGGAASTNKQVKPGREGSNTGLGGFLNNGSGAVVWEGGFTGTSSGITSRTFTLGGSNADANDWQGVIRNYGTNDIIGLTKSGVGRWILSAANTYTGGTSVEEGTLLIDGSTAAGSAVSVDAGAVIGGNGTISGDLTLAAGGLFAFDPGDTLDLAGNLSLDSSFGVASLRNTSGGSIVWGSIPDGTYTLMNTSFSFSTGNIGNFGQANAADLGSGKTAYFQQGISPASSLQLVIVPEPASLGLTALGALLSLAAWRAAATRGRDS